MLVKAIWYLMEWAKKKHEKKNRMGITERNIRLFFILFLLLLLLKCFFNILNLFLNQFVQIVPSLKDIAWCEDDVVSCSHELAFCSESKKRKEKKIAIKKIENDLKRIYVFFFALAKSLPLNLRSFKTVFEDYVGIWSSYFVTKCIKMIRITEKKLA